MGLRIAEISTLSRPVPPNGEGSVESLVSILTEGLVARGHDVTLFAAASSSTSARLVSPVKYPYSVDTEKWDWQLYEAFQVSEAFRRHGEFDVIHCHSYHHALLFCDFVPVPVLMSLHLEPGPDYLFLARRTRNRHLHFCSQYQARDFTEIPEKTIIPHGVSVADMQAHVDEPREDYLAFLGRFHPDKGPLEAIRIARHLDRRLLMAAPETDYFHSDVRREIDGEQIVHIGEVTGAEKFRFLSHASALLYPVQRGEPFGLVLIEALLSGTPVLAPALGAVPEIVEHGVTGWVVNSEDDYVDALDAVMKLDHGAIRRRAAERFSADRMIEDVEALMIRLVQEARSHA